MSDDASLPVNERAGSDNTRHVEHEEPKRLKEVLDCINETAQKNDPVSLEVVVDAFGRKSFAPFLLLAGLVIIAPGVGDIPTVPSFMGLIVIFVAVQLLFGRETLWLPQWMLNRKVKSKKLTKMVSWLRKPAKVVDKGLSTRLTLLTGKIGQYVIALMCIVISLATPPMEFVPFSAKLAGAALTAFGLALLASDGLFALFAGIFTMTLFGVVGYFLIF